VITFEFQDEVPPVKLDSRPSLVVVHLYPADKQLEVCAVGRVEMALTLSLCSTNVVVVPGRTDVRQNFNLL